MEPLEIRIEELERKLALYERYFRPERESLRVLGSLKVDGTVTFGTVTMFCNPNSPEGVVTAPVGSAYFRTDDHGGGSTLYIKEAGAGNTGWSTTA